MAKSRKTAVLIAAAVVAGAVGLFWSGEITPTRSLGLVTQAEAIVGRPLTPLSYAGVARRTTRGFIYGSVRLSVLPAGCLYGPYYGGNYWYCGGSYYAQQSNVYVQVIFQ